MPRNLGPTVAFVEANPWPKVPKNSKNSAENAGRIQGRPRCRQSKVSRSGSDFKWTLNFFPRGFCNDLAKESFCVEDFIVTKDVLKALHVATTADEIDGK